MSASDDGVMNPERAHPEPEGIRALEPGNVVSPEPGRQTGPGTNGIEGGPGVGAGEPEAGGEEGRRKPAPVQMRFPTVGSLLTERLGAAFFRGIPEQPGVYFLRGDDDRVLYVGKAGNLRQRLGSYRHPDTASTKTRRLVARVWSITWELCASEEVATLRENALLRTWRPRFNRAGVWPRANAFIALRSHGGGVELCVTREVAFAGPAEAEAGGDGWLLAMPCEGGDRPHREAADWKLFGAFKSGATPAVAALLRLLWSEANGWPGTPALPRSHLCSRGRRTWRAEGLEPARMTALDAFLGGRSADLLSPLVQVIEALPAGFERHFWESDREVLEGFYTFGPARNRELRERYAIGDRIIGQEELDDLLVRWRREGGRAATGEGNGVTDGI